MPAISARMRALLDARLANQRLTTPLTRATPAQVVAWFGAVQGQEYPYARWALGLRTVGLTDTAIEKAFDTGAILRTHVLRPTWHLVAPADLRWMLALSGPRVKAAMAYYDRQLELDDKTLTKSLKLVARALVIHGCLTRSELGEHLRKGGVVVDRLRLGQLMMRGELDAVVCSGPRRGKQFTYALIDDLVPAAPTLARDQALAELVRRYFRSHGPATLRDFAWWSGLTMADGKRGLSALGTAFEHREVDGRSYYASTDGWSTARRRARGAPLVHLLPIYDEGLIAYKDRDPVTSALVPAGIEKRPDTFQNQVLIDGLVAGSWRRVVSSAGVSLDVSLFQRPSGAVVAALEGIAERHGTFLNRPAVLSLSSPESRQSPSFLPRRSRRASGD
jgi:hypothetical protein